MYKEINLKDLIGKTIKHIYMNEDFLKFETNEGNFVFGVKGDCCSTSYFYDFYGVKNLLGNKVTEVKEVELKGTDITETDESWRYKKDKKNLHESIQVYGYQITTESPEFGPVTSVFSFRNYSNGYYGGWMESVADMEVKPEITEDVIVTETNK